MYANDLAHGTLQFPRVGDYGPPNGPQNGLARPGLYGPVAILVKTFGLSELTIAVYPLLASVVTLLLAYALARSLYGPLAGLLGIGLLAILPYDVQQASILQPDPIAAFWANVGVVLTYFGLTRDRVYYFLRRSPFLLVSHSAFHGFARSLFHTSFPVWAFSFCASVAKRHSGQE
jgi:hypothetical protein